MTAVVHVLYDAHCNLCRTARAWLERQDQLDPAMTLEDLTVVGDGGQVWVGAKAWVVCLWALRGRRVLAVRLAGGDLARARAVVSFVSRHRRLLGTYDDDCACSPAR